MRLAVILLAALTLAGCSLEEEDPAHASAAEVEIHLHSELDKSAQQAVGDAGTVYVRQVDCAIKESGDGRCLARIEVTGDPEVAGEFEYPIQVTAGEDGRQIFEYDLSP